MTGKILKSKIFYGNEVSEYSKQQGYVDYLTLSKAFDLILNNEIIHCNCGCFEPYSGVDYYIDEESKEQTYLDFYQYYIISEYGAEVLSEWTNEFVLYNSELNIYLWCISHYGTSWDMVLTDIKIERLGNEEE